MVSYYNFCYIDRWKSVKLIKVNTTNGWSVMFEFIKIKLPWEKIALWIFKKQNLIISKKEYISSKI